MLKRGLLAVSIVFQVLLVGVMTFVIYSKQEEKEIICDLFEERVEDKGGVLEGEKKALPFQSYMELVGVVVPASGYIEMTNPLEGSVDHVFVKRGDRVNVNQPLFKMCDKAIYVEIKEKEAMLNKSLATLTYHQKGPTKYAVLAKQKEVEEKQIKRDQLEKEAEIFKNLLEKTAVSAVESDEKHLNLEITEKELEKAYAELEDLKAPMSMEEKEIFLSDIEEKKASLKLAALKLESSLVKSPLEDATVVEVKMKEGEYLKEKGVKSVVLAQENPGMIRVSVDESLAHKIKRNGSLRAVASSKKDGSYHVLEYVSYNPKMSIYRDGLKKLDLYFRFNKEDMDVFLEQDVTVFLEVNAYSDLSFLHYKYH